MPELPEVETVKNGLAKYLPKKKIASINFDWQKSFPNSTADVESFLVGSEVVGLHRKGKALIINLNSKYSLYVHLRMTGQLVYVPNIKDKVTNRFGAGHPNQSLVGKLPDKSTRVTIEFMDGSNLYFNDQRKFGFVRLIPTVEIPNIDFIKKLGPEPLESSTTAEVFNQQLMKRKNSNIKAVILDQSVIAGIGNIYADESLWLAKINPNTIVNKLSLQKKNKLFTQIKEVLELAINSGGSTDKNYVNADGKKGSYLKFANVFRREGQPCKRCGTTILKIKVAGRGTHICPKCQKEIL